MARHESRSGAATGVLSHKDVPGRVAFPEDRPRRRERLDDLRTKESPERRLGPEVSRA